MRASLSLACYVKNRVYAWVVMHKTIDSTRVAGIPSSCQVPRSTGSPELGHPVVGHRVQRLSQHALTIL